MDPQDIGNNTKLKPPMIFAGTAKEGSAGPPIGIMDIGISEEAYLFRVMLPGIRKNDCNVRCEIQRNGTVQVRGEVTSDTGGILRGSSSVYQLRVQQLSEPGPFVLSFQLPGPVDPRLFSPSFRGDGILEGVVMKHRVPVFNIDG